MNKIIFKAGSLVLIRDTLTGNVMDGAKGQMMFSCVRHAKLSAGHTGWWMQHTKYQYLASIGKAELTERLTQLQEEVRVCMEQKQLNSYGEVDQALRDEVQKAAAAINLELRTAYSEIRKFGKSNTFSKNTRFVVEEVVELFSQTIGGNK